jgi:hypothetical protein
MRCLLLPVVIPCCEFSARASNCMECEIEADEKEQEEA